MTAWPAPENWASTAAWVARTPVPSCLILRRSAEAGSIGHDRACPPRTAFRSISELTEAVVSPAPNAPARDERAGVLGAGSDRLRAAHAEHRHRRERWTRITVAQLLREIA